MTTTNNALREALISRLNTASAVMSNLPEKPGYNGSVLLIDDVEAGEIAEVLDAASDALAQQAAQVAQPLTDAQVVACVKAAGYKTWDSRVFALCRMAVEDFCVVNNINLGEAAHGIGKDQA